MNERSALLGMAAVALGLCLVEPWAVAVAVAALAAFCALEGFRFRGDLKIVKDSAAALLKHDAQIKALERALEAATSERIA